MNYQNSRMKTFLNYIQNNGLKISIVAGLLIILLYFLVPKRQATTDYVRLFESSDLVGQESNDEYNVDNAHVLAPPVETQEESQSQVVYVDIKGAVNSPNMYVLPQGSRVYDAIEMAGGLTTEAATEYLNQAKLLEDQMLIYIQTYEEVQADNSGETDTVLENNGGIIEIEQSSGDLGTGLVNINSASAEELMTLPNIGPKKAEAILQYRQENGSFLVIEDIMGVSGIGEKTFESLSTHITVAP